jgi:hypothetical protein
VVVIGALCLVAPCADAAEDATDAAGKIAKLNRLGLDAFDNLNFDQARSLFEQALSEAQRAGLANDPAAARTHLDLGMLLIAGFQQRDDAVAHFRAALKIDRDIKAPAGLFNPEVQTVFDETKAQLAAKDAQPVVPVPAPTPATTARKTATDSPVTDKAAPAKKDNRDLEARPVPRPDEEDEGDEDSTKVVAPFFLSLGLGSGLGVARGHLDTNKDLVRGGVVDNTWSGGLAPSRLGHVVLTGGYFMSRSLLLSVEGRLQIVSGATTVSDTPSCDPEPCQPRSTAIAGLAKASWYFSRAPLRPFVSGGVGAGYIREVVKLNVTSVDNTTHCGSGGNQACVDTVSGGPALLAAGGGVAYEMGRIVVLGALTANVGVPNFMLNIDATLGFGLRL